MTSSSSGLVSRYDSTVVSFHAIHHASTVQLRSDSISMSSTTTQSSNFSGDTAMQSLESDANGNTAMQPMNSDANEDFHLGHVSSLFNVKWNVCD